MVRGLLDICTWFNNSNMPYWRIYPHKNIQGGNIIMQSRMEESQSHGDALQDLQHKIKALSRGTFTLVAFPEPNKLPTKGYWLTDIEITNEMPAAALPAQISGPPGLTEADVERRVEAALSKYKAEQELDQLKAKVKDLEKENKELKTSIDSPWNKVIGALAPYSDRIVGQIFPEQRQVAGLPVADPGPEDNSGPEEGTDLTDEQRDVLSRFVTVLAHHDPNLTATLRQLTEAIEKNPSLIGMVKKII